MDGKHNVVVNVRITPANINDADPITAIINDVEKRLGHLPKYMGVDAGYHTAPTCLHKGEHFGKYRFLYNKERDIYICPEKRELTWRTTNREGYREYWSSSKDCKNCPRRCRWVSPPYAMPGEKRQSSVPSRKPKNCMWALRHRRALPATARSTECVYRSAHAIIAPLHLPLHRTGSNFHFFNTFDICYILITKLL